MSIETLAEQICRFCTARACLKVAHGAHRSAVGPRASVRPGSAAHRLPARGQLLGRHILVVSGDASAVPQGSSNQHRH